MGGRARWRSGFLRWRPVIRDTQIPATREICPGLSTVGTVKSLWARYTTQERLAIMSFALLAVVLTYLVVSMVI